MRQLQLRVACVLGLVSALACVPAVAHGQQAPVPARATDPGDAPPPDGWVFPDLSSITSLPEHAWDLLSQTPQPGHLAPFTALYRATWFPDTGVAGQNTNLGLVRQEIGTTCPLWKDECDMVGLTTNVRSLLFHTLAVLPQTQTPFPQELWDIRFGLNYKHTFDNGWSAGATINFGSASDKPFHSVDELTAGIMGFLRIPVGEHNAWLFSLMYSPTGEVSFPIPGVAFYWQPSDTFNATIGVPFKLEWKPVDGMLLEASYMPLTTVRVQGRYRVWGGVSVYAGYENNNEAYFLADRADTNDRFFVFDQRVTAGVKMEFGPHAVLDLSSGYSFDRHFFEAHSINDAGSNRVDVGDTPFLSLMFQIRY
jgi:hypothetical protein